MAFVIPAYPQVKRVIKQTITIAALAGIPVVCLFSPNLYAEKTMTAVADLRYGVSLYNYYQDKNLEALSELLVAKQKGGIQGHGDNPEIMEAGFSMAYGMERKASEIFERLLTANRPQKTRDAAWFNLAQMRYSNQDWDGAETALSQIGGKPSSDIEQELQYLRFNLALKLEQLELAETLIKKKNPWQPYMHFNIASAYSNMGDYDKGISHYRQLLTMQQREPEFLALYDKAMTAAGYAHLLKEEYPAATELFSRVRTQSPFSSRALLGYGWAAAEQNDYLLALKPWTQLSKNRLIDQNTQEALIAIPFAHEKLNRQGLALIEFQEAEVSFVEEIQILDDVIQSMPDYAIRNALNVDRSTDINMLVYAQKNSLSPRLTYLVELFSRDDFLEPVKQLRDLLAIQNQYQEWQSKLGFYSEMINERELNRANEVNFVVQQDLDAKINAMEISRDGFAREIATLQKDIAFLRLLDEENANKLERILRAEKNIQILTQASIENNLQVMPKEELLTLSETLRKQKGFMVWRSQEMYEERLWRTKFELAQVNATLLSLRNIQANVQKVVGQNQDLQSYRNKIRLANAKLTLQNSDLEQEIGLIQDELRRKVLHELQLHRVRLKHYLAQSRLSIARLLDQAAAESVPPINEMSSDIQGTAKQQTDYVPAEPIFSEQQATTETELPTTDSNPEQTKNIKNPSDDGASL